MGNPEGGHGEKKDKSHFSHEIEKLFEEAMSNGQGEIAVVLGVLAGSMAENRTRELSILCRDFAKKGLERIEAHEKTPKN